MTDFIIKPIAPSGSLSMPAEVLRELRKRGKPENYFKGGASLSYDLPANILLWLREERVGPALESFHHRFILCLNLQTSGKAVIDRHVLDFDPGQGVLIFPFQFHHFTAAQGQKQRWIYVSFEMQKTEPLGHLRGRRFPISSGVLEALNGLAKSYLSDTDEETQWPSSPLRLALLLNEIARSGKASESVNPPFWRRTDTRSLAAKIQHYVYQHLAEGIRIKEIARHTGLSESRLRARYREELGISLGQTLRTLKLTRAMEFLTSSDKNITEISSACGYDSVFAFSLAFKNRFGLAPMHFRKRMTT